jgi:hypothetical protein
MVSAFSQQVPGWHLTITNSSVAPSPLQGYAAGFPIVLPTSVSQNRSQVLLTHLLDGNYLDALGSKTLNAELLLYNPDLLVLGYMKGTFVWTAHGQVEGQYQTW